MLAGQKGGTVNEEQGQSRQRIRNKKITYSSQQPHQDRSHGSNWSPNCSERVDIVSGDRKTYKGNHRKVAPNMYNRARPKNLVRLISGASAGVDLGTTPRSTSASSNISNYRVQLNKFISSLEEYRQFGISLKDTHEILVSMRQELLNSTDVKPDEIPDVQSSLQDILGSTDKKGVSVDNSYPSVSEKGSDTQDLEADKKMLEEALHQMATKLKLKEAELSRLRNGDITKKLTGGEGDMQEVETLRQTIVKLDQDNRAMQEKLKRYEDEKGESGEGHLQKIKSLERVIESLQAELKKLKDILKVEKEIRKKLEQENEKLTFEINELKSVGSSSDNNKYIILEQDGRIQDLQKRLNEISRIWPHPSISNQIEIFKVNFSTDGPSLINQLANFVQIYEELSRKGVDLESKLKESHMEIYRLEQILEKQLIKIKEQDECLKNMEESLSKVVVETKRCSRMDHDISIPGKCRCEEYQIIIKEREEFCEKLKEKMILLYQKYKQYKTECNLMRKKFDAFDKRSWLKKLVNI